MTDNQDRMAMRAAFEHWYATHAFNYTRDPIGSRDCSLQWKAWEAAIAHASAQPAQPASVAEPVAWMHDTKGDAFVISDVVKQLWLKAKPEHVEHYTVPLYTHPQPQSAMAQESGDV